MISPGQYKAIIASTVILLLAIGCSNTEPTPDLVEPVLEGHTYSNPELGITLSGPETWFMVKDVTLGGVPMLVLGTAPGVAGQATFFYLSVSEEDSTDLSNYSTPLLRSYIEQEVGELSGFSATDESLDGWPSKCLEYGFTTNGFALDQRQYLIHYEDMLLIMLYNCPSDDFATYAPAFEEVVAGLELTGQL